MKNINFEIYFWKKYLNNDLINFDTRLLKNFYLNQGYYDVEINSSFAKLVTEDEFELIYNINAKQKFYFGDLNLSYLVIFNLRNYETINSLFNDLNGKKYSLNSVNSILDTIDRNNTSEEFKTINAFVEEDIVENKINLNFIINEAEKYVVEKINIFGNNVTRENVIRNQLELDEGDPYNEILKNKSLNNIKGLNFSKMFQQKLLMERIIIQKLLTLKLKKNQLVKLWQELVLVPQVALLHLG